MSERGKFSEVKSHDDTGETLSISIRPSAGRYLKSFLISSGLTLLFLFFWVLSFIGSGGERFPVQFFLFFLISFLSAAGLLLSMLGGKQSVEVRHGEISVKNSLFGLGFRKRYQTGDITEFSFGPAAGKQADKYSMQIWFKQGKKYVFICQGLPLDDLKRLSETMRERLFGREGVAGSHAPSMEPQSYSTAAPPPLNEESRPLKSGESFTLTGQYEGTMEVRQGPEMLVLESRHGPNRGIKAGMLFFAMIMLLLAGYAVVEGIKLISSFPFEFINFTRGMMYFLLAVVLEAPFIFAYLYFSKARELVEISAKGIRVRRELLGKGWTHECPVSDIVMFSLAPCQGTQTISRHGPFYVQCTNKVVKFGSVISDEQAKQVFPLIVEKAGLIPNQCAWRG